MLIKGENLTEKQKDEVLRAFIYRWTVENTYTKPTIPLQSDAEWLKTHAFWFVKDGIRLARNRQHAEAV